MSLFDAPESARAATTPLPERMRPRTLDEVVGQEHLLAPGRPLREAIERDSFSSLIFWGPPGVGKTTVARLVAATSKCRFVPFSAVLAGIKEVREVMEVASGERRMSGRPTVVFIDEIHRFNKAQQDAFLPRVESGDVRLVGATTENPSFEVISALLSRSQVHVFEPLTAAHLDRLLRLSLTDRERGLGGSGVDADDDAIALLAQGAGGDARQALGLLEQAVLVARSRPPAGEPGATRSARPRVDVVLAQEVLAGRAPFHDKSGEEHFNLASALQKSIRSSDADAALYWLGRLVEGGEDPMFIARRLVRMASEDVGLADPAALGIAVAARDAVHFIGMPEGVLALAEAAVYLASAPKSNALEKAMGLVRADIRAGHVPPVPLHLRNAPTALMRDLGAGKGYVHAHDQPEHAAPMQCLPDGLASRQYLVLGELGFERDVARRLRWWARQRERAALRLRTGVAAEETAAGGDAPER